MLTAREKHSEDDVAQDLAASAAVGTGPGMSLDQNQTYSVIIALDPYGRAAVTRDMELIRKIVAEIQSWKEPRQRKLEIPDYDANVVGRHVEMLIEAGYVVGKAHHGSMGLQLTPFVTDLTMRGHDFAAAIQNEGIWAKIKQSISPTELATAPLHIIKDIGVDALKIYLKP